MRNALLIAYHYPPVKVSSGLQRTLANSIYLPDSDWQPLVLSAHPRAYASTDNGQLKDIPSSVEVKRAFALDTTRHLAIKGAYPYLLALPDPWVSWWLGGVAAGLKLIRRNRPHPSVIWSTYPIATAHLIALTLHRLTGIPWVADFRDSMTEEEYPREKLKRSIFRWIERKTVEHCSFAVFTTPGARRMYQERYPDQPDEKWQIIANGYDEAIFAEVEANLPAATLPGASEAPRPITLLHSGVIYPSERDPTHFFQAIADLQHTGELPPGRLRVVLRAPGHERRYREALAQLGIADSVKLLPGIPYRDALAEVFTADGLLVLQGNTCNHQVPAKLYEYFRTGRPILTLADPCGDTAMAAKAEGLTAIAPLEDKEAIKRSLMEFVREIESGTALSVPPERRGLYARQAGAEQLAQLFDRAATNQ